MRIIDAYIEGHAIGGDQPDEGFERKADGLYYPTWATDYLIVKASYISGSDIWLGTTTNGSAPTTRIYPSTFVAGQTENGWCLFFTQSGIIEEGAGWGAVGVGWAGGKWETYGTMINKKNQCYTFSNFTDMMSALLLGCFNDKAVYISPVHGLLIVWNSRNYNTSYPGKYPIASKPICTSIWQANVTPNVLLAEPDIDYYCSQSYDITHHYSNSFRMVLERKPIVGV